MPRTASRTRRMPGITTVFAPRPNIPDYIQTSLVPARAAMNDADARRQMANDLREGAMREGGVTRNDLEVLGWTPRQIDAHIGPARQSAQSLSVMT